MIIEQLSPELFAPKITAISAIMIRDAISTTHIQVRRSVYVSTLSGGSYHYDYVVEGQNIDNLIVEEEKAVPLSSKSEVNR